MSKSGSSAGSGSGAGRAGRPGVRASADAARAAKGSHEQRAARIKAKLEAKVRAAELARRRDMHDGKGGLNHGATPAMKAAAARHDRTIHRANATFARLGDAKAAHRKKASK
jgi:hypothetical protein